MLRFIMRMLGAGLVLIIVTALVLWFSTPDVQALADEVPATSAFMEFRKEEARMKGAMLAVRYKWVNSSEISRWFKEAVVACEDANFYKHEGFDWKALEKAARVSLEKKAMVRGGSTITQQLAKNLYLQPEKNIWRKLREALITWRLERSLGKERILTLYMNIVELGKGIFGIEAAARHYFKCSAARLDPFQAVCLATILPAPLELSPLRQGSRHVHRKRRRVLLYILGRAGYSARSIRSYLRRLDALPKSG